METYKGNYKKGEIEIEEERLRLETPYYKVFNDKVIFPNGSRGEYLRVKTNVNYGVSILPVTKEGDVVLLKNFRHGLRKWVWELPKGMGEHHLSPLECAKAELLEETGYSSDKWILIKKIDDSHYDDGVYLYSAIIDKEEKNEPCLQKGEAIDEIHIFPKYEIAKLIESDEVNDIVTLFCLQHYIRN